MRALVACALLLLAACTREPEVHEADFLTFGTLVTVQVADAGEQRAQEALRALEQDFRFMHEQWHPWLPGSVNRMNLLCETGEAFVIPPTLLPLIERGRALERASGGLFNPAIGKLVALWGFHSDDPERDAPPDPREIRALLDAHPSMADLRVDGIMLTCANPAFRLDPGGYAKGLGIGQAVERLREHGIEHAMINAGGQAHAIGRHGERPWRVGIRDPFVGGVIGTLDLGGDEGIATSGDYERSYELDGRRVHHIIDPRTGNPTEAGVISASVVHRDPTLADAAATALVVAGPREWMRVARDMGLDTVLLVLHDRRLIATPEMARRLKRDTRGDYPMETVDPAQR